MLIGESLGHYRIDGRLGGGGMGEVYSAFDTRLNRRVALKVLASELTMDREHRERFDREARAVAALNHPNIVTIHSVEEVDGVVFITMELVEGATLSELIPDEGLSAQRLLEIALPLTDALSAAHRSGITHRDLKPDNIMVDPSGRLKVLDFGLAKLRTLSGDGDEANVLGERDLSEKGMIVGTAPYMSPEQVEGKEVGPPSDVFSLGTVLYEMATGNRPFNGDSKVSVLVSVVTDEAPALSEAAPDLPEALAAVIKRCLRKSPDQRYASAAELRNRLVDLKARVSAGDSSPYRLRQRRWAFGALTLTAVAVVALIAVFQSMGSIGQVTGPSLPSIAVLPFENLSADSDHQYFADGITEEITSKLSEIRGLEVSARSSASRFEGTDMDARRIGEDLGVDYLLEGSVRKAANRVRIAARLVNVSNGFQLWAEDFEGDLDDVFAVQEETALKIADALDLQLTAGERKAVQRRYTVSPQAFDAYLRGRALLEYFANPEMLEAAYAHFDRALELDSEYPLALVGMSRVEAQFYRNIDPDELRLVRARDLAYRALAIEPRLAEAHLALGQVLANRYRYGEAAARFREAIRLEPTNAYAWDLLSWSLAYQQPPDLEAAEEAARKSISLQASLIGAHYHLGRALLLQGRFDEAVEAFEQSKHLDPTFESADYGLAQVYTATGRFREAMDILDSLETLADSPIVPVLRSFSLAELGETGLALEALERACSLGYRDEDALRSSPHLVSLRGDPRYEKLLSRYGMGL